MEKFEKVYESQTVNYPCDFYYLIFKTEGKLNEHIGEKHDNQEGNDQSITEAASDTKTTENNISNLDNSYEKSFQCDECNFKSSSENGVKIHKTKKHIHVCQFCYKRFSNSVEKSEHVVQQTRILLFTHNEPCKK